MVRAVCIALHECHWTNRLESESASELKSETKRSWPCRKFLASLAEVSLDGAGTVGLSFRICTDEEIFGC